MNVRVRTNAEPVGRAIRALFRDQVPFVNSLAVNRTALAAQKAQTAHMQQIFTVRNRVFVARAVKLKPKATKREPVATLRLEPPGGQARADILAKFETETEKTPFRGATIAVPLDTVRRSASGRVTKKDAIAGRKWTRVNERVSVTQEGDLTLVRTGATTGVIFRNERKGGTTSLYLLVPSVPIEPELNFVGNIRAAATRTFPTAYREAWELALRTAR